MLSKGFWRFAVLGLGVWVGFWAHASDATLTGPYAAEYAEAYELITSERVVEGAELLLETLRGVPTQDFGVVDQVQGLAQLLMFADGRLMSRTEQSAFRHQFVKAREVLPAQAAREPIAYPVDDLFDLATKLSGGTSHDRHLTLMRLSWLAERSDHAPVAAACMYLSGLTQHFRPEVTGTVAARMFITTLPHLDLARMAVDWPVYEAIALARNPLMSHEFYNDREGTYWRAMRNDRGSRPGRDRHLLEGLRYWEGDRTRAYSVSPGLAAAAQVLPSMHTADIDVETFAQWAERLTEEGDPRVRHTLVSLIAMGAANAEERAAGRPGLEAVAALPPATADVIRAQIALVHFALADHDGDAAHAEVQRLVSHGVLPTSGDFNGYEAVLETARKAARYFTEYGYFPLAIRTHEALAAKYPETRPGRGELERAERLKREGVPVAIELVYPQIDRMVRNARALEQTPSRQDGVRYMELARKTLEDIIEHTPNPGVRAVMLTRLERIEDPPPANPPYLRRNPATFQEAIESSRRRDLID